MKPKQLDCQPIPGEVPETVYRDDDIWVVNKPQGWLTHTDGATTRPDLVTWCGEPVGVHQRLDVDTTGVVAFSRSPQGARRLNSAFAERTAKKRYTTVHTTNRVTAATPIGMSIDLIFLEHLSTPVTAKENHLYANFRLSLEWK